MPRGKLLTKGQLYDKIKKNLAQLETFMIQWSHSLSLVILCSDESEGFKPRELWGIEYNKTLWEILLLMTVHNDKMLKISPEKASKFEYIICKDLPVLQCPEYTLELIYSHMISFKNQKIKQVKIDAMEDFDKARSVIRKAGKQSGGISIE